MKKHSFMINVVSHLDATKTARLLQMLINIGINDAHLTIDDCDNTSGDAEDVLKMTISEPVLLSKVDK